MTLVDFVQESNRIEGITRDPSAEEISAHGQFLALASLSIPGLCALQEVLAPGHPLRTDAGMDVQVGGYIAPRGGPTIKRKLSAILRQANESRNPWRVHCGYEMLHPFMDGNGRTGRAIWAWQMQEMERDPFAMPFLHRWYYQTLANQKER